MVSSALIGITGFEGIKYMDWSLEHQIDAVCIRNACEDGLDNDGDGDTDEDDAECESSGHLNERYVFPPPLVAPPQVPQVPALGWLACAVLGATLAVTGARARRIADG